MPCGLLPVHAQSDKQKALLRLPYNLLGAAMHR